jgi:hypothetical protein
MAEDTTPTPERTCANCACAIIAKHPQEINRTQLLCRKGPPIMLRQTGTLASGEQFSGMTITYAPTSPELVCFDGWRPLGTLPGDPLRGYVKMPGSWQAE